MSEPRPSLFDLEMHQDFLRRHIGPDNNEAAQMLDVVGAESIEQLIDETIPSNIRLTDEIDIDPPMSERRTISYVRKMKDRNKVFISMIGMGYYGTVTPNVIKRVVLENPSWYTAYTPYQAEVSQGRLEVLLNFQQMVMDMTGMEIANASLLDEATAAAEAMIMAKRVAKNKSNSFFVSDQCHPQTIAVIQTRANTMGVDIVVGDIHTEIENQDYFAVIVQYPDTWGSVDDFSKIVEQAHDKQSLVIVASDLLALAMLTPPGEWGADIVVGNSQRFGVPMGYGGPHAAFFATRDAYKRSVPGRIIGVSVDAQGKPALRMALQTREQHIRRDKATSNICTAQVLLAIIAALYTCYHGPDGIKTIARRVHRKTRILAEGLQKLGYQVTNETHFDTLCVHTPGIAWRLAAKARESRINVRVIDSDYLGIALDETTRRRNIEALWQVFDTKALKKVSVTELDDIVQTSIPENLQRQSDFLTHPVFNMYHSETEMLRYCKRLANKDIALDRSMIPLGSCTMKLNATTEMIPITFRNFAAIHPFAPLDQTQGYQQLFEELENMLCELTGFDRVSLQPNAGSQGEYTGLLCIRKYHETRGDQHRNICLIPQSSHGTNPASAVMAGFKVMVVKSDEKGNVDVTDLKAKAEEHKDDLAALMITYPSTHGVFEQDIVEICQSIHDNGGQVYMDGANLNAMVGLCKPGQFGADVMHMNLHKTFCIPHGGGGPGMGPIGVGRHLAPYLPNHVVVEGVNPDATPDSSVGTIAAAPWSSASILPISWAYIALMGAEGLKKATQQAILNANYIATRLNPHFPVLYSGKNGRIAHECIIDLRGIKEDTGISVDDVAKRLVDFGFHAPTMSFPVVDTLMVEPTESENKAEIDRFCDAMIHIRQEISAVESGAVDATNNVLTNAPHTQELLIAEDWEYPYSKETAFFPLDWVKEYKYWPPVARVDNVYGDRNLVCACPPMEDYMDEAA